MKKWYTVGLLVLIVAFAASLLVACESEETTTTTEAVATTEAVTETTAAAAATEVTWEEAIDYEGETVTMTGPVVALDDLGEGIGKYQLRIGSAEDGVGANGMVTYDNASKFDLESYKDKEVKITGVVAVNAFELKAEIELTDPSQIEIVGDAAVTDGGGAAYTTAEAMDHYGETGSITGEVVAITDLGEGIGKYLIRLDSEEDGEGANGMVTYDTVDAFGGAAALDLLIGKTITITGDIYENTFQGKAEIELTEASQLGF